MKSQKKIAAVLLIAACLGGYAAAPVYAAPKAQNQVNRILNKLDRQRDTQLRQQSRNARTARQQQLREQARPARARQTPSATAPPICRTSSAIRRKIRKTPVRERRKIESGKTNGASRGKREAPFSYAQKK